MRWFDKSRLRLRSLFQRSSVEQDLEAELQFHIDQQIEENLAAGMSPAEARQAARRAFGNVGSLKEETRDCWGIGFLDTLRQDLRFAWRSFRRSPGMAAAILITLALGIGVGTAIFSIVNAVLLKPLPYKDPDRLVVLAANFSGAPMLNANSMGASEFLARRERSTKLRDLAAYRDSIWRMERGADRAILHGVQVSKGFFDVLGVEPAIGRRLFPEDQVTTSDFPVILLDAAWRKHFHADPAVIGKRYRFWWDRNATVVGVMPPGFVFARRSVDYLIPVGISRYTNRPFHNTWFQTVARLEDGVTIAEAQAEQDVLTAQFKERYPEYQDTRRIDLLPLAEESAGEVRPALAALLGAVALVMLIVCANVANLLLGRALARRREIGVRAAIGAGRARLVRQLLTESLLLSLAGGGVGFAAAHLMVGVLQDLAPDRGAWGGFVLQAESIRVDGWTMAFAVGMAILAGLVFGIVPALRASGVDFGSYLQSGARSAGGGRRDRLLRSSLVVTQTALAFILVCGAGLLVRSLLSLYEAGPGFRSQDRLQVSVMWSPAVSRQRLDELRQSLSRDELRRELGAPMQLRVEALRDRLLALPNVRDLALSALPAMAPRPASVELVMDPSFGAGAETCEVIPKFVSHDFFSVMGIPVLEGRSFLASDRLETEPVMILSRQAARDCAGGGVVVGSIAQFRDGWLLGQSVRIIGVVGDVRYEGVDTPGRSSAYATLPQIGEWGFNLIVQTSGNAGRVVPGLREAILDVDPDAVIQDIQPLDRLVRDAAWKLNYSALMLSGLAALSLLLAAVGVYAVLNEMARSRTREIGLQMALGAGSAHVLQEVLQQGLALVGFGLAIGIAGAAGLTRFLRSLLFGVEPLDPATFAAVAAILLGAALCASYFPARRAARVNPMTALRHE